MGILKKIFTARHWWKLVPDQSIFASGASGEQTLNASARSADGDSVIVYLSSPTTVLLKMNKISASQVVRAKWVNPETGEETIIGDLQNSGTRSFTTPQSQEDAVLLLDAVL